MKMTWIKCDKTFDRALFEEIGKIPEGKREVYILLRCQAIVGGKPNGRDTAKLLSVENVNGNMVGRIDGNRYFEFFDNLYVTDYLEVEMD